MLFHSQKRKNKDAIIDYYNSDYFSKFPKHIFNIGLYSASKNKLTAQENFVRLLAEKVNIKKEDSVIDIGCGSGGSARFLVKRYGCKVAGITISKKQVKDAQFFIKNKNIEIRFGDAHSIPFKDECFDKAICLEAAFHFFDKQKFCEEAYRVLKKHGEIAIADLTIESQSKRLHKDLMKCISKEAWKTCLTNAGFQVKEQISLGAETFAPALNYFTGRLDLFNEFPHRHQALLLALRTLSEGFSTGNGDYSLFIAKKL